MNISKFLIVYIIILIHCTSNPMLAPISPGRRSSTPPLPSKKINSRSISENSVFSQVISSKNVRISDDIQNTQESVFIKKLCEYLTSKVKQKVSHLRKKNLQELSYDGRYKDIEYNLHIISAPHESIRAFITCDYLNTTS